MVEGEDNKIPNYLNIFELENPNINLDEKLIFIFNWFSELHVKLLEQAMISYLKTSTKW